MIQNTPEAELMAEKMNMQIAAWCHFYWKEINPGAKRFYRKLSDRAFSQVLLHEIMECSWDSSTKSVTSPRTQSKMSAIAKFEQLNWVKSLSQDKASSSNKKRHVDPNVAFSFQDDFAVGTIHGSNLAPTNSGVQPTLLETIVIGDEDDDISIFTSKTSADSGDPPPLAEEHGSNAAVGDRVASRSDQTPVSSPTANTTTAGANGDNPHASPAPMGPAGTGTPGRVDGGPVGK